MEGTGINRDGNNLHKNIHLKLEMGELAAPYIQSIEGFTNPTIDNAINAILNRSGISDDDASIVFLKSAVDAQKITADTLIKSAGRITNYSNQKNLSNNAYDAGFETDTPSQLTGQSDTLQGFSYLLFFISFLALAIVLTIKIYVLTTNPINSALAFLGFIFLGVFLIALVRQTA